MLGPYIRAGIVVVAGGYMMLQFRKPSRWLGRIVISDMNRRHSPLTDWGLSHVEIGQQETILDVGCGGGATIKKLAALAPRAKVHGIDYAAGSVAAAQSHNRELIAEGRVTIQSASVSKLPFADDAFDLVTAIETQYYWPNLPADMREILRVLKPGGKLIIIAESFKGASLDWLEGPLMRVLLGSSRLTPDDQRALFEGAGFTNVEISADYKKHWICAFGAKPPAAQ